jgi:cell division septation protein DedD
MIQPSDSAASSFFSDDTGSGVEIDPSPAAINSGTDTPVNNQPSRNALLAAAPAPTAETSLTQVPADGISSVPPDLMRTGENGYEMPLIAFLPEPEWKEDVYLEARRQVPPPEKKPEPEIAAAEPPQTPVEPEAAPAAQEKINYSLLSTEQRPPVVQKVYEIPPDKIIPSIAETAAPAPHPEAYVFIDPIPEIAAAQPVYLPPEQIIPPVEPAAVPPEIVTLPPEPAPAPETPVRTIDQLERGKYYVQLGAFARTELVDAEINRIDTSYPIAVQQGGTQERPVYRILLGPLNLGESGAVLQRFKSIGYKDAFVRTN